MIRPLARARRTAASALRRAAHVVDGRIDPRLGVLERYVKQAPHPDNAVRIFQGEWSSRLPDPFGRFGGAVELFDDPRLHWLLARLGSIEGWDVLELGPLEGGHTTMLERAGAGSITAVEANTHAYLRCLIVKELVGLERARFVCGDALRHLEQSTGQVDLVVACGILHHLREPLALLHGISTVTDRVFLWTHYDDPDLVSARPDLAGRLDSPETLTTVTGFAADVRTYRYRREQRLGAFSGGGSTTARWLQRDDILAFLAHLGFEQLDVAFEQPDHPNGPAFAVLARR